MLEPRDYSLSMRTSRRSPGEKGRSNLRSLLVHRLRDGAKAVLRLPLKTQLASAHNPKKYQVHCEPCDSWFSLPDWAEEVTCPKDGCGRLYAIEFAVFSEIKRDPEPSR